MRKVVFSFVSFRFDSIRLVFYCEDAVFQLIVIGFLRSPILFGYNANATICGAIRFFTVIQLFQFLCIRQNVLFIVTHFLTEALTLFDGLR